MEFISLNDVEQLNAIDLKSTSKLQAIYKHSTRCSISLFTQRVLINELTEIAQDVVDVYHLDLLKHRNVSDAIEKRYSIEHESPQLLIIDKGKCIYHVSHSEVSLIQALAILNRK